jgi:hypothetical protein
VHYGVNRGWGWGIYVTDKGYICSISKIETNVTGVQSDVINFKKFVGKLTALKSFPFRIKEHSTPELKLCSVINAMYRLAQ